MHDVKGTQSKKKEKKTFLKKILCMCVDMGIQVQGTMEARCQTPWERSQEWLEAVPVSVGNQT